MTIIGDAEAVLRRLAKLREQPTYAVSKEGSSRDAYLEEVFSPSPLNFTDYMVYELERELEFPEASREKTKPASQAELDTKCTIIDFNKRSKTLDNLKFQFEKKAVTAPPATGTSELAKLLAKSTAKKDTQAIGANVSVKVYFPSLEFVLVQVNEKMTVEEVIQSAIQQYEVESSVQKKSVRVNINPKAYIMRFAEDDGQPDEDMPAINKNQEIGQFKKFAQFALCPDTTFKTPNLPKDKEEGSLSPPRTTGLKLFKVYMDDGAYVSFAFQAKETLKNIMQATCIKRDMTPEDCRFEYFESTENTPSKRPPLTPERILGELGVEKIKLIEDKKKSKVVHRRSGSAGKFLGVDKLVRRASSVSEMDQVSVKGQSPNKRGSGPIYFYTSATAKQYQEFPVFKIDKQGKPLERTLGIDGEKIKNMIPEKSSSGKLKTKHPERSLSTLISCFSGKGAGQFFIEFKDRTYKYESEKADEIIAKLTFLIKEVKHIVD